MRRTYDLARFQDGGRTRIRVRAVDGSLGRVQPPGRLRVSFDLHDDTPPLVEHPDRYDAVLVSGPYERLLKRLEELGQLWAENQGESAAYSAFFDRTARLSLAQVDSAALIDAIRKGL
ncbi:hypothetical protein ACIBL5_03200 [Streptomyces sp. NPDC050516]|uniref:hypothetical protein n=1 Tax=Streptomyces sp. NPDC050516 TaxID=3365621 RepID=UPI0037B3CE48